MRPKRRSLKILVAWSRTAAVLALVSSPLGAQSSPDGVWKTISPAELEARSGPNTRPWARPDRFAGVQLVPEALSAVLAGAPMEFTAAASAQVTVLSLPRPDGTFERFAVVESPVMHPELEQRMAELGWPMKTYRGTSLDHPANVLRLDWGGPAGFHGMVLSPDGGYFIDPYWQGDTRVYSSYFQRDYTLGGEGKPFVCEVGPRVDPLVNHLAPMPPAPPAAANGGNDTGGLLRSYRLATAATGEYTDFHGGSAADGQAAITTTMNRVNMVYERDFSVRMVLVANNIDVVYTDGGTDPYSNTNCGTMLNQNQTTLDTEIGNSNYDIGHVVSTGGGGVAQLNSPCDTPNKAKGCTGLGSPIGDPFDIDFVSHEMGHQWDGQHTWNGTANNCSAGQWASTAAYEPGSGSTIQAYAGICGVDDLQQNSDDHFHRVSLDEMGSYMNGGGNCFTTAGVINPNAPTADAGADVWIPIGTPFELTGSGSDADGDTPTFNWEQFDLGTREPLATGDDGVQPIFRSWPSSGGPTRVFPRSSDLAAGVLSAGETLPVTNRTMNFRMTVRDNRSAGGRESYDAMQVTSTTSSGPFVVTAPNGGEDFAGGSMQTVTWNVAGTTGAPVSTPTVDIYFSSDGGLSFPTLLASSVPNDGSQIVTLPSNVSTAGGRIKVKGAGNVFFDISDANFLVDALNQCDSPALAIIDGGTTSDDLVVAGGGTLADLNVTLDVDHTWVGDLTFTLEHLDTGTSVTFFDRPGVPGTEFGCGFDDIQADLDDEAPLPVEDQCGSPVAISGIFSPNNPLSAFDGEAVGGTWRLTVDDFTTPDGGTLNMWCLSGSFEVAGGCPTNLVLDNQTLSGTQTLEATASATLGPALIIDGTNIVINAPTVSFGNGVEVGGTFQSGNSTSCP